MKAFFLLFLFLISSLAQPRTEVMPFMAVWHQHRISCYDFDDSNASTCVWWKDCYQTLCDVESKYVNDTSFLGVWIQPSDCHHPPTLPFLPPLGEPSCLVYPFIPVWKDGNIVCYDFNMDNATACGLWDDCYQAICDLRLAYEKDSPYIDIWIPLELHPNMCNSSVSFGRS